MQIMKRLLSCALAALFLCGSLSLIVGCEETTPEDEAKMQRREVTNTRPAPNPGGTVTASEEEQPSDGE
jgi:hypothetical protein